MTRKLPEPDYVVLHLHRLDPADPASLERLEHRMASVENDLKKIRKAFDRMKKAEEKEDADAAAFKEERNAKVAELQARVADLESRPTLSEADRAELDALAAELEAAAPPDDAPTPPTPEPLVDEVPTT